MMKTNKLLILSVVALLAISVLSLLLGSVNFSVSQVCKALVEGPTGSVGSVVWYVRIPRTIACLLAGSSLAVSGLIIQKVLGNRLASPGIIGVNAGAGLAITVCFSLNVTSGLIVSGAAFVGAVFASSCIIAIARFTGMHRSDLILSGLGITGLLNAASELIKEVKPEASAMNSDFMVGGFSTVVGSRLLPVSMIVILSMLMVSFFINDLDVLSMGEDTAKSLGMNTSLVRIFFLLMASALAGAAVSIAGMLSFVGLIVPHIVRHLAGNKTEAVLPLSVSLGGTFVTLCDILSRLIFAPYEVPAGILISAFGSPFLIFLLLKSKKGKT